MSNFERDKSKTVSSEENVYLDDDNREEDDEVDEIEVDTELFIEQLYRFPCFADVPRDKSADELFDIVFNAYQDENLSEEQDHVVELLLHLQEEESPFNLTRAFEVWGQGDRQSFIQLLHEMSDIVDADTEEV